MAASYISVPRDLTKVKSKVMFNLTKRQLICFSVAVLLGVPSFFLIRQIGPTSTAAIGMMIIMMPFFFLAMYEKNGRPLEVILGHMIEVLFISHRAVRFSEREEVHNGQPVWCNELSVDRCLRYQRPYAGGFSEYGIQSDRDDAYPVGRSERSDQNRKAYDHRTGPQQDRGAEKGGARRLSRERSRRRKPMQSVMSWQ